MVVVVLLAPLAALGVFVAAFEVVCGGSASAAGAPYEAVWAASEDRRPEAQSWLTYPEWHIVYSAEAYAATLESSRPSRFGYVGDVAAFWRSYCAVNRATSGMPDRTTYKVTIYTIGVSYTAEMLLKGAYETTIGRAFEWLGGYPSAADLESARIQADYGAFLHETPWYEYPFTDALGSLWAVEVDGHWLRHWERTVVLSAEYASKAAYGRVLGAVVGATGQDERTMRMVIRGAPEAISTVDQRLAVRRDLGGGLVLVETPRYEQFTDLVRAMAGADVQLVEIAGNDDIFVTLLLPEQASPPGGVQLFVNESRFPGLMRAGLTVKVADLLEVIRAAEASGARLEHVYDY